MRLLVVLSLVKYGHVASRSVKGETVLTCRTLFQRLNRMTVSGTFIPSSHGQFSASTFAELLVMVRSQAVWSPRVNVRRGTRTYALTKITAAYRSK